MNSNSESYEHIPISHSLQPLVNPSSSISFVRPPLFSNSVVPHILSTSMSSPTGEDPFLSPTADGASSSFRQSAASSAAVADPYSPPIYQSSFRPPPLIPATNNHLTNETHTNGARNNFSPRLPSSSYQQPLQPCAPLVLGQPQSQLSSSSPFTPLPTPTIRGDEASLASGSFLGEPSVSLSTPQFNRRIISEFPPSTNPTRSLRGPAVLSNDNDDIPEVDVNKRVKVTDEGILNVEEPQTSKGRRMLFNARCLYRSAHTGKNPRPVSSGNHSQEDHAREADYQDDVQQQIQELMQSGPSGLNSASPAPSTTQTVENQYHPSPRCCHSAVAYDDRYLIISFGGCVGTLLNDTYVFDTQPPVGVQDIKLNSQNHPTALRRVCCPLHQFDTNDGPLVLPERELKVNTNSSLEALPESAEIMQCDYNASNLDPMHSQVVPIGDGTLRWTRIEGITVEGNELPGRISHTAILRDVGNDTHHSHKDLLIFGGHLSDGPTNETLRINATQVIAYHEARVACAAGGHIQRPRDLWGNLVCSARAYSRLCCDCQSPSFIKQPRWEVVRLDTNEKAEGSGPIIMPRPRSSHTAVFYPLPFPTIKSSPESSTSETTDFMFVLDGWGAQRAVFNDLWALDLNRLRWRIIPFVGIHKGTIMSSASWARHQRQLLLNRDPRNTDHNASLQLLNPPGCPRTGLFGHCATVHGTDMYVFGGSTVDVSKNSNDLHKFNFHTFMWTEVVVAASIPRQFGSTVPPQPAPRYTAQIVAVGDYLYVHGGDSEGCSVYYGDLWRIQVGNRSDRQVAEWERLDDKFSNGVSGVGYFSKERKQVLSMSEQPRWGLKERQWDTFASMTRPFDLTLSSAELAAWPSTARDVYCQERSPLTESMITDAQLHFGISASAALPTTRSGHTMTVLGGALVVFGGEQPLPVSGSSSTPGESIVMLSDVHSITVGYPTRLSLRQLAARWLASSVASLDEVPSRARVIDSFASLIFSEKGSEQGLSLSPLALEKKCFTINKKDLLHPSLPLHRVLARSHRTALSMGSALGHMVTREPCQTTQNQDGTAIYHRWVTVNAFPPTVESSISYELTGCTCLSSNQ